MNKKEFKNLLEKIKTVSVSSDELLTFLRSEEVLDLTKKMSIEQRFEFLCFPIAGQDSIHAGLIVAYTFLEPGHEEQFTRITQGLSVEQRFELLQSKLTNRQNESVGMTLAMSILRFKRNDDFTRLTQGFSVEQCFELLRGKLTNPQDESCGATVAMTLIIYKRYEDFTRLTQGLTAQQSFEILQDKLTNPQNINVGAIIAVLLLLNHRYDDFRRLTQGLSAEQCFEILRGKLTNPQSKLCGATVALFLIWFKRYEDFTGLLQGFSGKEIVKLTDNGNDDKAILKVLCERKEIKILNNVLDRCDYESLQTIYNRLPDEAIELEFVVFHCFQKLDLMLVSNIQGESCKYVTEQVFKDILNALFAYQHQITKPDLKKQSLEYLQALLWIIAESVQCRKWTYEVLSDAETLNEKHLEAFNALSKISKRSAVKNFGFYLSCLLTSDGKHRESKMLAMIHAETLEKEIHETSYANIMVDLRCSVGPSETVSERHIVDITSEMSKHEVNTKKRKYAELTTICSDDVSNERRRHFSK